MSDAVDKTSCIKHRANSRYFTFYEDYQDIAPKQHSDKIAAFLRVLEVKTNKKMIANDAVTEEAKNKGKKIPKTTLWLEIKYSDFVNYSLETVGRSSFQIADRESEKLYFSKSRVLKRHSRENDLESPLVDYKEYILIRENVQAAIDGIELPITGDLFEKYPNIPPVENNRGKEEKSPPVLKTTGGAVENNRGELLKTTGGAVENNNKKDKSKRDNKDNTNESSSYEVPDNDNLSPSLMTTAATLSISQLKDFSPKDLTALKAQIDVLLREPKDTDQPPQPFHEMTAPPVVQNGQYDQIEKEDMKVVKDVEEQQALERPSEDTPRTAETVVQLVEYLRGAAYAAKQRSFELRKAGVLLSLKEVPDVSMAEIEEAWLHGSDEYWRSKHAGDDLHVHDLVNKDSNGKVRVQAFLEHKRAQDRRGQRPSSYDLQTVSISPPEPFPKPPVSTLSEEQAQEIVEQIALDAQEHGYRSLQGMVVQVQEGAGWVVRVSWRSIAWKGDLGLEISSERQWQQEFHEWRGIIALREKRHQKAAGVPVSARRNSQEDSYGTH